MFIFTTAYPLHPRCDQTANHGGQIEGEEAHNQHVLVLWDDEILIGSFDVWQKYQILLLLALFKLR